MFLNQIDLSPLKQALLLLVGAALLAGGMAALHPAHNAVAELASIPMWRTSDLNRLPVPTIRVAPLPTADGTTKIGLNSENFDTQVERIAAQFHGPEWIVVSCQSPGCEEGWALAKRLRHFGFPKVAMFRQEDKR